MQNEIGHSAQSLQAAPVVKIGQDRCRPRHPPGRGTAGIAQQGIDAITRGKTGENAAGDVPAADNQDFLHAGIVAEQ